MDSIWTPRKEALLLRLRINSVGRGVNERAGKLAPAGRLAFGVAHLDAGKGTSGDSGEF